MPSSGKCLSDECPKANECSLYATSLSDYNTMRFPFNENGCESFDSKDTYENFRKMFPVVPLKEHMRKVYRL